MEGPMLGESNSVAEFINVVTTPASSRATSPALSTGLLSPDAHSRCSQKRRTASQSSTPNLPIKVHRTEHNYDNNVKEGEVTEDAVEAGREKALKCLFDRSQGVFVLEVYTEKDVLLQVQLSTKNITMLMDTLPWSMDDEKHISKKQFETILEDKDRQTRAIIQRKGDVFSPGKLVSFVIDNCDCVPTLVSSDYTNLMGRDGQKKRFLEYLVYQKILSGSQECRYCDHYASVIRLDSNDAPTGLFCNKHARKMDKDVKLMLYNPLVVALTAQKNNVIMCALNPEVVCGARDGSSEWSQITKPKRIPIWWTPLCKRNQPKPLETKQPVKMMLETARNLLDCADELSPLGTQLRHSLTCRLLDAFMDAQCPPKRYKHLDWGNKFTEDDYPYGWWEHHLF